MRPVQVVDEVFCDVTGQSCEIPSVTESDRFEYAELTFSGGYWGEHDLLSFVMQIHPSVAVGLYAASLPEDARQRLAAVYKFPKVRLVVEE